MQLLQVLLMVRCFQYNSKIPSLALSINYIYCTLLTEIYSITAAFSAFPLRRGSIFLLKSQNHLPFHKSQTSSKAQVKKHQTYLTSHILRI